MSVLIVTWSGDNDSVEHVSRLLGDVLRLDTDRYPQELSVSTRYDPEPRRRIGNVPLDAIRAVWYRRFRAASRLPQGLGDTADACYNESRQTLWGTIATLPCFQLDPISAVRRADYKELQLELARAAGLDIPRTLFSNDPAAAREFYRELDGRVVTKMQSQFAIYRGGEERVVFTNRVRPEHLERLDGLRYSPMIFQEMVPRALELRSTVVGEQVFTAGIRPPEEVDWRRDGVGLIDAWTPYSLPSEVEAALLRLTRSFGLNYAAADFILTPDGCHVFLEINAAGEWFWLQRLHPIAEAIAGVLSRS